MTLRNRLQLFALALLLIGGAFFVALWVHLHGVTAAVYSEYLRHKATTTASALAAQLDVAIGSQDQGLVHATGSSLTRPSR